MPIAQRGVSHQFGRVQIWNDYGGMATNLQVFGFGVHKHWYAALASQDFHVVAEFGCYCSFTIIRDNQRIQPSRLKGEIPDELFGNPPGYGLRSLKVQAEELMRMGNNANFARCDPPAFGNECACGDVAALKQSPQSLAGSIVADGPIG
jgi:hypothetical protein